MKKLISLLLIGISITAVGCTAEDAVFVNTDTALSVAVNSTIEDDRISTMAKDYFVGVAEGDITGHAQFNKLGYNAAVGTTEEDIWFGSVPYVFPTVAQQMELVSSSIEDDPVKADASPGTGVHSVIVTYLDGDYVEHTEVVALDGTAVVTTTATDIFRVNDMRAYACGTDYKAAGNIVIRNLADTPAYSYIVAGYTKTRCSICTVPAGKTVYVQNWYSGVGGLNVVNNARLTLRATYNEASDTVLTPGLFFMPLAEMLMPNGTFTRDFIIPIKIPATCDIKISAMADQGSAFIETACRGWME